MGLECKISGQKSIGCLLQNSQRGMCVSGPECERGNFVANAEADRVIYSKIIREAGIKVCCKEEEKLKKQFESQISLLTFPTRLRSRGWA